VTAKKPNAMTRAETNRLRRQPFDEFYLAEPTSGCWLWERNIDARGYGIYRRSDGKTVRKGRHVAPKGQRNRHAVLDENPLRAIRADERPRGMVAADHGVSKLTVWEIRTRRTWKHLT
jgi:hypothetical protein